MTLTAVTHREKSPGEASESDLSGKTGAFIVVLSILTSSGTEGYKIYVGRHHHLATRAGEKNCFVLGFIYIFSAGFVESRLMVLSLSGPLSQNYKSVWFQTNKGRTTAPILMFSEKNRHVRGKLWASVKVKDTTATSVWRWSPCHRLSSHETHQLSS